MRSTSHFLRTATILCAVTGSAFAQTAPPAEVSPRLKTLVAAAEGVLSAIADSMPAAASATLGVSVDRISDKVRDQFPGIKPAVGLGVRFVVPDGPAAAAKIAVGDILLTFGEHPLAHPEQLRVLVATAKPGDVVDLTYMHQGQPQRAKITLGKSAAGTAIDTSSALLSGIQAINGFVLSADGHVSKLPDGSTLDIQELLEQAGISEATVQEAIRQFQALGIHCSPPAAAQDADSKASKAAAEPGLRFSNGAVTLSVTGKFTVISPTGEIKEVTMSSAPDLAKTLVQLFKQAPPTPAPDR